MPNASSTPPFESFPREVRDAARRFLRLRAGAGAGAGAPGDEGLPALTRMKEGSEGSETKEGSEGSERSESSENSETTERSEFSEGSEYGEYSERGGAASAGSHPPAARHTGEWGPIIRTVPPARPAARATADRV